MSEGQFILRAAAPDGIGILADVMSYLAHHNLNVVESHDFGDGRSRYEPVPEAHHDHLIDLNSGEVIEFVDEEIEALQDRIARKLGYELRGHRLELYGVPLKKD